MISIVTAYYNRKELLRKTLLSISKFDFPEPVEFIAVDDGSIEEERIEDLALEFTFLKVVRIDKKKKWYNNSCIPFNEGFRNAKGDKIIIQNPECYHFDNVIDYASKNLFENNYLSFSCFALDKQTTDSYSIYPKEIIDSLITNPPLDKNKTDDNIWYNHSKYRPEAFHFCVALTKKDLDKLQGFDELFSLGIAFDDNEFVRRIKKTLNIQFIDEILVLHQNHYKPESTSYENRKWGSFLYALNNILYRQNLDAKLINRHTKKLSITQKKIILVPYITYRLLSDKAFYRLLKGRILKRIA
jgi:GT2 family glycosyltransferase